MYRQPLSLFIRAHYSRALNGKSNVIVSVNVNV